MLRTLQTAKQAMHLDQARIDTLANNLANVATTGFRQVLNRVTEVGSDGADGPGADGLPQRIVSLDRDIEAQIGKPIVSSDTALYWRIFKTLGTAPIGARGQLLSSLQ